MKLFIIFNVITFWALVLTGLLTWGTSTVSQVVVYGILWIGSLSMLLVVRVFRHKESEWLVWENDPGTGKATFLLWLMGFLGVFSCAQLIPAVLVQSGFRAALFVPQPNVLAATLPFTQGMLLDIFFNMTVVGNVEQMSQISSINAVASKTSSPLVKGSVALLVIALISAAHGYIAYQGPLMWVGIIAAFGAFTAMFILQLKTGSLLLCGEVHAAFNTAQIIIPVLLASLIH